MAYLIDPTYFVETIEIPNKTGLAAVNVAIDSSIDRYISIYEPIYLTNMLGAVLYADLMTGLNVTSPAVPAVKWTNLKNALVNSTTKRSPIANYIYFFYCKNKLNTGIPSESPAFFTLNKGMTAWNEMVLLNETFASWWSSNSNYYSEYLTDDCQNKEFDELFSYMHNWF